MSNEGPLSQLLHGLGMNADLPPIETPKRIDVMPIPVNLPEIDLRNLDMDLRFELHGTFRGKQQWTCFDEKTYDGPESPLGEGESKVEAFADLLEKRGLLDKVDTHTALEQFDKPRAGRVVHSSPFEPPTIVDDPVTFDDDLDDAR
jgi:hypothetical protein